MSGDKREWVEHMSGTPEENRLKRELVGLFGHLNKLRRELASLHGGEEHNFVTMSETLDDIVKNTENASNTILESVESIDEMVGALRSIKDPAVIETCDKINDRVNQVFEACSFQDLTGQRITRLVKSLTFIEERVNAMIRVWGRDEISKVIDEVKQETTTTKTADEMLLHGPQSESKAIDQSEVDKLFSQDDIDKLFG
jgi:chemotaxis protein CheZ